MKFKKLLTCICTLLMLMSLLPMSALAANGVYVIYGGDSAAGKTGRENKMNAQYDAASGKLTWDCSVTGTVNYYASADASQYTAYSGFARFYCLVVVSSATAGSSVNANDTARVEVNIGGNAGSCTQYSSKTETINPYIDLKKLASANFNGKTGTVWVKVFPCNQSVKINENLYFWINAGDIKDILDYEAVIGTTGYSTFESAVSAAADNSEIELLKDVTVENNITINKPVTIVSQGETAFKISGSMTSQSANTGLFCVGTAGNVTFENVTIDGTGMPGSGSWCGAVYTEGAVTLGSGATVQNFKWTGTAKDMGILFASGGSGKITIADGAKITGCIANNDSYNECKTSPAGIVLAGSNGTITMTGGAITGNTGCTTILNIGIYLTPEFIMTGGKITGNTTSLSAVYMRGAYASGNMNFGGDAYIYDNTDSTDTSTQKNLYLKNGSEGKTEAYAALTSALTSSAKIGVNAEYAKDGVKLARGGGDYTSQASDANYIVADSSSDGLGVIYNAEDNALYLSDSAGKKWQSAADSGSYTSCNGTYGVIRFMFLFGEDGTDDSITSYGIKYLNADDFSNVKASDASASASGAYSAFQGDVIEITENSGTNYYAKAFIVRNGITYWSDIIYTSVDWTNKVDYTSESAESN